MRSFLKKSFLNIAIWLLIFPMATLSSDEFIVKDIKIEGLEKISEGALLNYLPVNIGDNLDESRIQESIRSVYSSGFFKVVIHNERYAVFVFEFGTSGHADYCASISSLEALKVDTGLSFFRSDSLLESGLEDSLGCV